MTEEKDLDFWPRFAKSSGRLGLLAVVLLLLASRINGSFDWKVFAIGGAALLIAWSRSWVLVPIHMRNQKHEDAMWDRFFETDWKFVDAISELSGTELDDLRALFQAGADDEVRAFVKARWSYDGADMQAFLHFFNQTFNDTVTAYIDDTGRLQPFD